MFNVNSETKTFLVKISPFTQRDTNREVFDSKEMLLLSRQVKHLGIYQLGVDKDEATHGSQFEKLMFRALALFQNQVGDYGLIVLQYNAVQYK